MGILVDMSGILCEDFAQRLDWPVEVVLNVLDWDINDVFNDSTTQEVNWHRHMTRGLTAVWLLYEDLKAEPLANKVTRTRKKSKCGIQQYNRRTHGYDEQRSQAGKLPCMNSRQFKSPFAFIDWPEGRTKSGYIIINCWNNGRTALTDTGGVGISLFSHGVRSELVLRPRFTGRLHCRGSMDIFIILSYFIIMFIS